MAKPTSKINWTKGNPNFNLVTVEPSSGKKINGWGVAERPAAQIMNWIFFNICEWIDYFEETTDALIALQGVFDAVIGTGGTFANFNDMVASQAWADDEIKNIIVVSTVAFDAPITIDKNDVMIQCKPGANLAGTSSANRAFVIQGDRVRIFQCRFQNFIQPGDAAIEFDGANYPMVIQNYFLNNTKTIEDTGSVDPVTGHNVVEA